MSIPAQAHKEIRAHRASRGSKVLREIKVLKALRVRVVLGLRAHRVHRERPEQVLRAHKAVLVHLGRKAHKASRALLAPERRALKVDQVLLELKEPKVRKEH